jgi:hypothetical protein
MSIGNRPSHHSHSLNQQYLPPHITQPPPQGQPQPFASLHAHAPAPVQPLYGLQDYPIGINSNNSPNNNNNNLGTNPYWNTTSASAPGSAYTNLFPGGVGGFGSPDNSPIATNFSYDHGHNHGHGQGQGQNQMVDIYGNPAGQVPGHGQGQQRTGFGGAPRRRGDSINGHGNELSNSHTHTTLNALYNAGGYGRDHLDSVPSSPMSMSSGMNMGMMPQYYGYGAEPNYFAPSGMYLRGIRGGAGGGKHVSHLHLYVRDESRADDLAK